jgi:hypothetical protein
MEAEASTATRPEPGQRLGMPLFVVKRKARSRPKAAVFVDVENQSDLCVSELMRYLKHYNTVERHAYADWRNWGLDGLAKQLTNANFQLYHARSGNHLGEHKDTADGHMVQGTMRVFDRRPEIDVFIIVSGDGYFVEVMHDLQLRGKEVVVAANPERLHQGLRCQASRYLPLGEAGGWLEDKQLQQEPRAA